MDRWRGRQARSREKDGEWYLWSAISQSEGEGWDGGWRDIHQSEGLVIKIEGKKKKKKE